MKAININWETDGYDVDLPTEVVLPIDMTENRVADYLSDEYGYLVNSFEVVGVSVKKAVAGQIMAMFENNILNEYGTESFEGWCEDGEVFVNSYPDESDEFYEECTKLMREVSKLVDKLTYEHLSED